METHMFVIQLTPLQMHWLGYLPGPDEVKKLTGIESVHPINNLPDALTRQLTNVDQIFLDFQPVSIHSQLPEIHQLAEKLRLSNPQLRIKKAANLMALLREIKADWEIERIKTAVEITHSGISRIISKIRPGIREFELGAWFNLDLQVQKSCNAFPSIIANGKNATTLHYNSLEDKVVDGDLLLLDLGAEYRLYSADISRTFPVSGTFTPKQKDLYNLVLEANEVTIDAIKPGIPYADLNKITRGVLSEGMKKLGFIKSEEEISKYYTHGVSHQLGLDTHDVYSGTRMILQPGMVLTIEPGLYIPDLNIGIRIEDDVAVTEDGYENLSSSIPKTVDAIEEWMDDHRS